VSVLIDFDKILVAIKNGPHSQKKIRKKNYAPFELTNFEFFTVNLAFLAKE
jgi:hypothetical protein